MDIEFIPKIKRRRDRASTLKKLELKIEESIRAKRRAELETMSQEDKRAEHLTAIHPEIPKTKKGIDKAIDVFINDFNPDTDNGEELLFFLRFFDLGEDIEEGDWTIRAKYLRERIKFKEEGDNLTILSSFKEVVDVVREYLQSLPTEELYNLWVFGVVVTEEDANKNKEWFIDRANSDVVKLSCYAIEKYNNLYYRATEDEMLLKAGEGWYKRMKSRGCFIDTTEEEKIEEIEDCKEQIIKVITDYPTEATAYYRGLSMIRRNYSEEAILSTIDVILNNGTTTD